MNVPAGPGGAELFHLAVMAWALLGFANVYTGIARRAYDLTVASSCRAPLAQHEQPAVAPSRGAARGSPRCASRSESIDGFLSRVCEDWSAGVDHGPDWAVKILSAKYFAVTQARSVVDTAFDVAGGSAVSRPTGSSRSFAMRASGASTRAAAWRCSRSSARRPSASPTTSSRLGVGPARTLGTAEDGMVPDCRCPYR